MHLVLAQHSRRFRDQKRQKIECFRRDVHLVAVFQQEPPLRIELKRTESDFHRESPELPPNRPESAPDLIVL